MKVVKVAAVSGDLAGLSLLLKSEGYALINVAEEHSCTLVYLEDSEVKDPTATVVTFAAQWGPVYARSRRALDVRMKPTIAHYTAAPAANQPNGDDSLYPLRFASFTKGLPHDGLGHVDPAAYSALLAALASGSPSDFAAVPLGGTLPLRNPQAGYSFTLEGHDPQAAALPPAPAFASAEEAGEMVELYWQALLRDVRFDEYAADPLAALACADLTAMSDFRGPKVAGSVTPATLFRGVPDGNLVGPYVSQFLYKTVPFGTYSVAQKIQVPGAGADFLTAYGEWLAAQDGAAIPPAALGPARYMITGRDLSEWVHNDFQILAGLHACLLLLSFGPSARAAGIPYKPGENQDGFVTFGPTHFIDVMARVANYALRATWFQKWMVHRRLRPEEFGGRVQNQKTGAFLYPIHPDVLGSSALAETFAKQGTYLLSQSYPEGCPAHTAYPSGHATFAGATATVLKAIFDESFVIPSPVQPNADGSALVPYVGPPLTVRGELDKLAFNVGMGRNFAGIHWRTDASQGNALGESMALAVMRDAKECFNEAFSMSFHRFDGTPVTV